MKERMGGLSTREYAARLVSHGEDCSLAELHASYPYRLGALLGAVRLYLIAGDLKSRVNLVALVNREASPNDMEIV